MKLITINVSDEEHKKIKLEATQAGLSIKDYLLRTGMAPKGNGGSARGARICKKHQIDENICKYMKH